MVMLKKLTFAPFFLIIFAILLSQIAPILNSYEFIFSLSVSNFISLVSLSALIFLTSLSFTIFSALSLDWKIVTPIGLLAALAPLIFFPQALAIVFSVGVLVSLLITYLSLENTMKTYTTFQAGHLFGPAVKYLCTLLILVISISYFFSLNSLIQQKGFQIPDALIDAALKIGNPQVKGVKIAQIPTLSKEQLELLRNNPDILKQYGIDPKMLYSLPTQLPTQVTNQIPNTNLIKQTIKSQIDSFLKPYLGLIAPVLALMLFFTLQSITSIIRLLAYPLLWIIFFILEKSGFIKFTTEMREVKKMVI